jgi:3-oxoacyl-(acyl-carrier-protein) synthase
VRQVSLTSCGAVTAFGAGEQGLWQGLLAGEGMFRHVPAFLEGAAPVAQVPAGALQRTTASDRTDQLLEEAALQIQASPAWSRVSRLPPERVGICIGTTQGPIESWTWHQQQLAAVPGHRPEPPSIAHPAFRLARRLGTQGPLACPSMACASGTAAVGLAMDWIRAGQCDAALAGGVDALSELVYHGFTSLKALDPQPPRPFDRDRAGLGLGEGAGLALLEADVEGAPVVAGRGLSADANHLTGPDPTGAGLARAIQAALADANTDPDAVGFINAHGTATVFNDLMESKAFRLVFGNRAAEIPTNSIKGAIGHTMGAAGALEAILCALVLRTGQAPPTAGLRQLDPEILLDVVQGAPRTGAFRCALSTSSGFGGINAALVFVLPDA